jgi:hypothetical protein
VLQVKAVTSNVVKLVEVEGLGPRFFSLLPAERPRVVKRDAGRRQCFSLAVAATSGRLRGSQVILNA